MAIVATSRMKSAAHQRRVPCLLHGLARLFSDSCFAFKSLVCHCGIRICEDPLAQAGVVLVLSGV